MGRRGPAKTPADVKRRRGTYRKDRDTSVAVEAKVPGCPTWLGREGKAEWRRVSQLLASAGLLAEIDRAALALYCDAWDGYLAARRQVLDEGAIIEDDKGHKKPHPAVALAKTNSQAVLRIAQQFGMTPACRAGLKPLAAARRTDELEELLR